MLLILRGDKGIFVLIDSLRGLKLASLISARTSYHLLRQKGERGIVDVQKKIKEFSITRLSERV